MINTLSGKNNNKRSEIRRFLSATLLLLTFGMLAGCGGGGGGASATSHQITGSSGSKVPVSDPTPPPVISPSADYFSSRFPHWTKLPIRVRFDRTSGVTTEIEQNLRQGMDAWSAATGGRLSYTVVTDNSADIVIDFRQVSDTLHGVTEGTWYDDGTIINMSIHLSLKARSVSGALQTRIMAHEWGHAIGLIDNQSPYGHSDVTTDRMYPVLNPNEDPGSPILSARDITTIKRVYGF